MTKHHQSGFTWIELAVAIFVIALLLGNILVPLAAQVGTRQVAETQKTMDEIRDALLGFAATNGYLPCPDLQSGAGANDGTEDIDAVTGLCSTITVIGSTRGPPATSTDELENADNDRDAVSRTLSNVAGAEFDDVLFWLPTFILNNRIASVGILP